MLREAKSTARILKGIHKKIKKDPFYVLKDTFKALAGRGNLRNVYLLDVNRELHKRGLTLVDLRKLRKADDYIAVIETKKIFRNWKYLSMPSIKKLNIPRLGKILK